MLEGVPSVSDRRGLENQSAGVDGLRVSPQVVLSLEGGYDLAAMCDCAQECVRALLGERVATPAYAELARRPAPRAQRALLAALAHQAPHWPSVSALHFTHAFRYDCSTFMSYLY